MLTNTNILLQQEKKLYKARKERTFMHKRGVKELVVLICILFDTVCMKQAVDLYFTQKAWMSAIITVAMAFVLDVPPMLLGAVTKDRKIPPQEKKLQIIGLLSAFLLMYLCTFGLRFASMDEMFPVLSIQIAGHTAEQAEVGHTFGQYTMAFILAITPLGTSIVSFVLGMQDDPEEAYRHQLRLNRIELRQQINARKVEYTELSEDMEFDLNEYDKARYDIRRETIRDQADILKSDARKHLAEKLGGAEAVTELMEKPHQPRLENTSGHTNRLNLSA